MSSEQRDVRPFARIPQLEQLFKHSRLRYGMSEIEPGTTAIVEDDVYLRSPVRLALAANTEAIAVAVANSAPAMETLGVAVDDLRFVVVVTSSYLKNVEFLHDMPLHRLCSSDPVLELSTEPRPAPFRSPQGGCTVEVLVYLAKAKVKQPLKPWRYGTWLERAEFAVVTEAFYAGFTPKSLTAAEKTRLGLPPKAMRYITLNGLSPLEADVGEEAVELWLDSELLATMSASPKSKASVALQRQLFVDTIVAVVHAARLDPELTTSAWPDVKDSLLGRVISAVAPKTGNEEAKSAACGTYLEMIRTDPAKFVAFAEEAAGLLSAVNDGLES